MTIIDTLKLSRALRSAGMAEPQAEAVAAAINDSFVGQVAEKRDLAALSADLGAQIAAVRSDLGAQIAAVRSDLGARIDALNARLSFQQWQLGAILALLVALLVKLVVFPGDLTPGLGR